MKKITVFVVALALTLSLAIGLTACKDDDLDGGDFPLEIVYGLTEEGAKSILSETLLKEVSNYSVSLSALDGDSDGKIVEYSESLTCTGTAASLVFYKSGEIKSGSVAEGNFQATFSESFAGLYTEGRSYEYGERSFDIAGGKKELIETKLASLDENAFVQKYSDMNKPFYAIAEIFSLEAIDDDAEATVFGGAKRQEDENSDATVKMTFGGTKTVRNDKPDFYKVTATRTETTSKPETNEVTVKTYSVTFEIEEGKILSCALSQKAEIFLGETQQSFTTTEGHYTYTYGVQPITIPEDWQDYAPVIQIG